MKKILSLVILLGLISGCAAPFYKGSAIEDKYRAKNANILIVEHTKTRAGFLNTLKKWLEENEYSYSVVENKGDKKGSIYLNYIGHWNWDLGLYLDDAKITASLDSQSIGDVKFRAPNTLNPNKFGKGEERISYMMDILFGKLTAEEATEIINSPKSD